MNIWMIENWRNTYKGIENKAGLVVCYENGVDLELKEACKRFFSWLRKKYDFPIKITIYIKATIRIKAKDGDQVCGTIFEPYSRTHYPYIRIATGDYNSIRTLRGRDNAIASILFSIAHELTHYFQLINDLALTDIGKERQANRYANCILDEYADYTPHP